MLAFYAPARALPALTLPPLLAVAAAVAADRSTSVREAVGALNAAITPAVGAVLLGSLLRRAHRRVQEARQRSMRLQVELARREGYEQAKAKHLSHTLREIVPWLSRVVDEPDRLDDPQVRMQAMVYGFEARDDLNASGLLTREMRSAVQRHRRAGGYVTFGEGLGRSSVAEQAVSRVLEIADSNSDIRVGLAREGSPDLVRLTVVPGLPGFVQTLGLPSGSIVNSNSDVYGSAITFRVSPIGDGAECGSA
jgi:hypothetical protein